MSLNEELARIKVNERLNAARARHVLARARADQPASPSLRERLSDKIGTWLVRAGEWFKQHADKSETGTFNLAEE